MKRLTGFSWCGVVRAVALGALPLIGWADESRVESWPVPAQLRQHSRMDLAIARANGETAVDVIFAAKRGRNAALAKEARRLGGEIRYRADEVDYLRVRLPLEALAALSRLPQIEGLAVDRPPEGLARSRAELKAIGATLPEPDTAPTAVGDRPLREADRNSPRIAANAENWLEKHPTFDGRGVVIGYTEPLQGFDLLMPEFSFRTTLEGKPAPKIVGYYSSADPADRTAARWIEMNDFVEARADLRFEHDGRTMWAPRPGRFRAAVFVEPPSGGTTGARYHWDVNQNGRLEERLLVLWDPATDEVWVDGDAKGDLRGAKSLSLRQHTPDIGVLGRDDPDTPVRESIGYTVQASRARGTLILNLGVNDHAGLLSTALANGGTSSRFKGIAPGSGCVMVLGDEHTSGKRLESAIEMNRHREIDLMSIPAPYGGSIEANRGRNGTLVDFIVIERLAERWNKPMVLTGGNSGGEGEISELNGDRTLSISGYISRETLWRNFGLIVADEHNPRQQAWSAGPAWDGGLEPDLLAPTGHVANSLGFSPAFYNWSIKGFARLPPGYSMGGGTSQATPNAAGLLALLVSAAKQSGVPHDAARVNFAVRHSARFLPNWAAHAQGNGLIDVAAAWELLRKLEDDAPVEVEVQAPVRGAHSALLPTPHVGRGLYEREGWSPGQSGERVLTLRRMSGPSEPVEYSLTWLGNEAGVFAAPLSVRLPLNKPVSVPVRIGPLPHGASAAILDARGPTPGQRFRVLCTIISAEDFPQGAASKLERTFVVPLSRYVSWYFRVPPGTESLQMRSANSTGIATVITLIDAQQRKRFHISGGDDEANNQPAALPLEDPLRVEDPVPGVWQAVLELRSVVHDPAAKDPFKPVPVGLELELNRPPEFPRQLLATVAAAVKPHAQRIHRFQVPAGVTRLTMRAEGVAQGAAPDLFVMDFTQGVSVGNAWVPTAYGEGRRAKSVDVHFPRPGEWIVVTESASPGAASHYTLTASVHTLR